MEKSLRMPTVWAMLIDLLVLSAAPLCHPAVGDSCEHLPHLFVKLHGSQVSGCGREGLWVLSAGL